MKKLEEQVHEIEENEESIKMELETSQQLEDELTRQMESSQKWLEKEREAEAAEVVEERCSSWETSLPSARVPTFQSLEKIQIGENYGDL